MSTYRKIVISLSILLLFSLATVRSSHALRPDAKASHLPKHPKEKISHCCEYEEEKDDICKKCDEGFELSHDHTKCYPLGKSCYFEHCQFCQVTPELTDYSCTVCEPGYQLTFDNSGGGVCKLKNTIEGCLVAETNEGVHTEESYCLECDKDLVLSNDGKTCSKLPEGFKKVKNCHDYEYTDLEDTVISCLACKSGYTVTLAGTCRKETEIENCDVGLELQPDMVGDVPPQACLLCQQGYIGIFVSTLTAFYYPQCMTFEEYAAEFVELYGPQP